MLCIMLKEINFCCNLLFLDGGIQLEQGLYISALHSGRVIGKDGILPSFGDRIISVSKEKS